MPLVPGTSLGPYDILALIGQGGMGEVYRARDTTLRRDVALKVLPAAFAADPDRRARFTREAHVLATLNHPHIASIYGVEQSGGVTALVLELVDGVTLEERLSQGPLSVADALRIAKQIAEALDAAHEKGVVHRDLKPANIKLTGESRVKVLDFGLAKALVDESGPDAAVSPTITAVATRLGVIVGTAAYMAPEQAKGKVVDKRVDIWAFGCVLYEMLTGARAFAGEDVTDLIVAVMTKEPDWARLPVSTPSHVVDVLQRCLKKDPRERLRDIGDAAVDLEQPVSGRAATGSSGTPVPPRRLSVAGLLLAGIAIGGAAASAVFVWRSAHTAPAPATAAAEMSRTTIELPANAPLALGTQIPLEGFDSPVVAISPDSRRIAYIGQSPTGTLVYVRDLASDGAAPLSGTEGAIYPFFSPDGRWIGFLTNDRVKKISVDGGAAVTLCEALAPVSARWLADDSIVFGESEGIQVSRVDASRGGKPAILLQQVKGVSGQTIFSDALPDGSAVLMTAATRGIGTDYADVLLVSLSTGATKTVVHSGYDARYVAPGYLLFGRGGQLYAARFDASAGHTVGEVIPLASGVSMESFFGQMHAAATDRLIVYAIGGDRAIGQLAWVDRSGATEWLRPPAALYGAINLSRDGRRVAVHVADVTDYVLVFDLQRGLTHRIAASENLGWPVWGPDNRTLAFSKWQTFRSATVVLRDVDGGGGDRAIGTEIGGSVSPSSWSPTGSTVGIDWLSGAKSGLAYVDTVVSSGKAPTTLTDTGQAFSSFSPDGHWVAVTSFKSSRPEIFIQSYPDGRITHQISTDGGLETLWLPNGELFYRRGNRWVSTKVRTTPTLEWDPPRVVFQTDFIDTPGRSYAVSPDGMRLLVVKRRDAGVRDRVKVIGNWTAAVPR